jgi:predicted AAA+ superfamily ATPase
MSAPTIFTTCKPRADVLSGATRDEQFMADLSQVVNGTALPDYLDPALFFRNTFPTRGLKELMKAVCLRLSGKERTWWRERWSTTPLVLLGLPICFILQKELGLPP